MDIPTSLLYTPDHEWLRALGDNRYRLGISDYAQDQLGDVVFVETGEIGRQLGAGDVIAEVESTKSVGEIYAPADLTVLAVNPGIQESPELVNTDPYGDGWLVEVEITGPLPETTLDAEGYAALIA